jgi:hypothetical protein
MMIAGKYKSGIHQASAPRQEASSMPSLFAVIRCAECQDRGYALPPDWARVENIPYGVLYRFGIACRCEAGARFAKEQIDWNAPPLDRNGVPVAESLSKPKAPIQIPVRRSIRCQECNDTGATKQAGIYKSCACPIGQAMPANLIQMMNGHSSRPKLKLPTQEEIDEIKRVQEKNRRGLP